MNIRINNDIWEVKMIDSGKKKMNPSKGTINLGLTEYVKGVINIRKGMTESVTRSTVIHELVHAFIFSYGYIVEDEEGMCDFFGSHADRIMRLTDDIMKVVNVECCQQKK